MTGTQSTRLTLELELDSEPIRGSLTGERGDRLGFVGWLGLAAALQRAARSNHATAPAGPGGRSEK